MDTAPIGQTQCGSVNSEWHKETNQRQRNSVVIDTNKNLSTNAKKEQPLAKRFSLFELQGPDVLQSLFRSRWSGIVLTLVSTA